MRIPCRKFMLDLIKECIKYVDNKSNYLKDNFK